MWSYKVLFTISATVKLLLINYGQIHDVLFEVKYTDIDYHVFVDASKFVYNSSSPYNRYTYRYSPLIAWMLLPSVYYFEFGKILFCFFDLINSYFILRMCRKSTYERLAVGVSLFNPFTAIISSRGNAEALVSFVVLLTLYLLKERRFILAAVVHGAAVHLKIYPIIYLPAIFFSYLPKKARFIDLFANLKGFGYIFVVLFTFGAFNLLCFCIYGQQFLDEALLYHVKRTDVRHNFSPYFYPLYLTFEKYPQLHSFISIFAFLPQLICILAFGWQFNHDLEYCWFITTFAFVVFNKVCTSQYFVWYLTFVPLLFGKIELSYKRISCYLFLWLLSQGLWLFFAYLLEFRGFNVFLYVWLCSIIFLCTNAFIIYCLNKSYTGRWNLLKND